MHIGIDGATWGNSRGYGRFTRELLLALARIETNCSYSLFLDPFTPSDDVPPNVKVITVPTGQAPARAASADGYRSLGDLWAFSRAMARAPVDLIFFPSVYSFVPVLRRVPVVVGVHDVIAERFPQYVFKNARARLFWNLKTRVAIWQATRVLTVSEHSRRGIQEHFHLPRERICLTGEAAAAAFRPISDREAVEGALRKVGLGPDARVILYFGGLSPHKNIEMLVGVFAEMIRDARFADVKLLIAGDYAREVFYSAYPSLRAQVEATCGNTVTFTGHVDDETAALLMNGAQVCVLPSLDEGFGLPGIEAAACGTPLIATSSSAMPEVLGDAGIYIDPSRPEELRGALEQVLQDPALRASMCAKGMRRARSLTWEDAAGKLARVFEELSPKTRLEPVTVSE